MKLNSTENYLTLILRALETAVIPDLTSAPSRGAADLIRTALLELLKRQGPTLVVLRDCVLDGEMLAREMESVLGLDVRSTTPPPVNDLAFDALVDRHAALTARLNDLGGRIAASQRVDLAEIGPQLLRKAAEWEAAYYARVAQTTISPQTAATGDVVRPPLTGAFLEEFLNQRRLPGEAPVTVTAFEPVSGGFGKQTFLCAIKDQRSGIESGLVVRKTDPHPISTQGFCVLEQEYHLLRSLEKTGFPAPRPQHFASDLPGVDGDFYTMARVSGRVPGSFLGGMQQSPPESVFLEMAELLARLHSYPISTYADYLKDHGDPAILTATTSACYRRNIASLRRYAEETEHLPSPFITWLIAWLERNIPEDSRPPVLVHGDFNVHNVLAEDGKITVVLDWECADFGAPAQDLAYIQPHISKHIDWNRFVDHYVACGGVAPEPKFLPFYLCYGALRTTLGGIRGTLNLQRGINPDIRYIMVEQGFAQAFMQMSLAAARG